MAEGKNNRNSDSPLFRRLTRLFSGPIVNYRAQLPRRERRRQLDKYASQFTSASGQQFKKVEHNPYSGLSANVMAAQDRARRYTDFDQMEYMPELASALDIYADEMTTSNHFNKLLDVKCPNEEIKNVLNSLYYNVLNLEFNLFGWCRTMCKYGDFFLYLDIDEKAGITNAIGLPNGEVERLEGEDEDNPNYVQFQWNSAGMTFENWQVGHFRILGNDKYTPYGTSILEPARRIHRQLILLEDAMMAYRIVRSPERRVFYIDVGNVPAAEMEQYMQRVMTQMKRNQIVDPDTGRVDLRYNPMSIEEDYYIPVRGGQSSRIETLAGGKYTDDIEDVKYLRDKLFSAIKIPAAYLSSESSEEDSTTLAQKDIRFARTIQRLQRAIVAEVEKIGIIHLYTLGYRGDDLVSFSVSLNNPSKLAELQELEHLKSRFDVASQAVDGYFSRRWIANNVFSISDEEFYKNQIEMFYDRKHDAQLEAAVEATVEDDMGLGGGGDLGGDLGGELGGEGEDLELGGEEGLEDLPDADAAAGAAAPEDDSALLAAPAKRDVKNVYGAVTHTTTPAAKGSLTPKSKGDKRKTSGPRTRAINAKYNKEKSGTSKRAKFPGSKLLSLGYGINENDATNYNGEERRLFESHKEIKDLIAGMESLKDETET
tara:strand:- start:1483 stop:3444 length:1962 start_codon:yes stop_codon:yes gene_type:complete